MLVMGDFHAGLSVYWAFTLPFLESVHAKSRLVETLRFRIYASFLVCREADTSSVDLPIWGTLKRVAMHRSAGVESRLMGLLRVAVVAHHGRARGVLGRMA